MITDEMMTLLCAIRANFALSEKAKRLLPEAIESGYVEMVPALTDTGDAAVEKFVMDASES